MRRCICGSTEESSWRNWLKQSWTRSEGSARLNRQQPVGQICRIRLMQLCLSQIINRRKTLADIRAEYDQELLMERRPEHRRHHRPACDGGSLWVKHTMSQWALQHH